LRQTYFDPQRIDNYIDSMATVLDEAQQRNFQKWPILSNNPYVWPCPPIDDQTYNGHVTYLKTWIQERIAWLDQNMIGDCSSAVDPAETSTPGRFQLYQNYPNPFNATSIIGFWLPESSPVQLGIYDLTGRELKRLLNEKLPAGEHSIRFTANDLSSGVYFYQIKTKNSTYIKKMVLIK
jgi:hypothetical protein